MVGILRWFAGSAEPEAGNGETVVAPELWQLIKSYVTGKDTGTNTGNVCVKSIQTPVEIPKVAGLKAEFEMLSKSVLHRVIEDVKSLIPGQVKLVLHKFVKDQMPQIAEMRNVTGICHCLPDIHHIP